MCSLTTDVYPTSHEVQSRDQVGGSVKDVPQDAPCKTCHRAGDDHYSASVPKSSLQSDRVQGTSSVAPVEPSRVHTGLPLLAKKINEGFTYIFASLNSPSEEGRYCKLGSLETAHVTASWPIYLQWLVLADQNCD